MNNNKLGDKMVEVVELCNGEKVGKKEYTKLLENAFKYWLDDKNGKA